MHTENYLGARPPHLVSSGIFSTTLLFYFMNYLLIMPPAVPLTKPFHMAIIFSSDLWTTLNESAHKVVRPPRTVPIPLEPILDRELQFQSLDRLK
jgi:hypothetical protein